MRKHILVIPLILLLLPSCAEEMYVGQTTEAIDLYRSDASVGSVYYTIPRGSEVVFKKVKKSRKYLIEYDTYSGYAYAPAVSSLRRYKKSKQKTDASESQKEMKNTP